MIAISYRREDSLPIAGRLYDRLRAEFGKTEVFMDFDSIPYGMDFRAHIKKTLERADVVVAVIGPAWAGQTSGSTRRIDDPKDFVRLEIAATLERGIPLIPVLVDNTPMPAAEMLPKEIEALSFRNGLGLDSGIDFHHHADRLIAGIRELLKNAENATHTVSRSGPEPRPPVTSPRTVALIVAGIAIAVLAVFGIITMQNRLPPVPKENPPSPVAQTPEPTIALAAAPVSAPPSTVAPTPSPNPPTPSPNAPAVPFFSDEDRVRELIRDYYAAFSRHDVDAVVENFADIVDYQGEGLRTKQHIRAEAEAYLRRWDRIVFFVGDISVSRRADGDFAASFSFPYTVGSKGSPPITGRSVNQWVLRKDAQGILRIVLQRETVQSPADKRRVKP